MGASRGRGPTIRDVARQAGVSAATVSRVLNDSPLVVEPTRARVKAAVDELGYRMNATARTLSLGRSTAVGVGAIADNLFVANMDLCEFARAVDGQGVFRNFENE